MKNERGSDERDPLRVGLIPVLNPGELVWFEFCRTRVMGLIPAAERTKSSLDVSITNVILSTKQLLIS